MTCRNCKFLDVAPDKAGRRIPRKGNAYRCTVEVPTPIFPASVHMDFRRKYLSARSYMAPEDGEGCPLWEIVEKGSAP